MVIFGKLAKLLLCYKRYVLSHPGLHLPCSPERAWWIGQLGMFKYFVYAINHGQESALDGRVRTHGLTVAFLYANCNHAV